MELKLANFQKKAIDLLMDGMSGTNNDIILKAPTGSGKTIILTHFMNRYLKENAKTVFVWLTPGKGELEEQSKKKMDKYIHGAKTKLLSDVMTLGFNDKDCCFINWEKLTKKGNKALSDSERTNFLDWINNAIEDGLSFKIIIDESHQNFTAKSDEVVQLFKTDKIIRCSATPLKNNKAFLVEISDEEVIEEGLIKKLILINQDFPQKVVTDNQTNYLLQKALEKQMEILSAYASLSVNVNPLIIVQLPNNSDALLSSVEEFFSDKGITYENGKLALWLSGKHLNLDAISDNDSEQTVIIIKQAVATGWDCPRAHILVKLRDNMDEVFEIQTIGRIRRMPETKHYNNPTLDSCYLYTFDSKFTEGVKLSLGKNALDAKTLFLKKDYKTFSIVKEQKTELSTTDPRVVQRSLISFYDEKRHLTGDKKKNEIAMKNSGYIFDECIVKYTISGKIVNIHELSDNEKFNAIEMKIPLSTHEHGRDYHHCVALIGKCTDLPYQDMNAIIFRLFGNKISFSRKFLNLSTKEIYSFVINNTELLINDFREAMAAELEKIKLRFRTISEKDFRLPQSVIFTFDSARRNQNEYDKNVYSGYLSSATPRSSGEAKFEKFCQESECIDWFYKNGDKGEEFFSIVYYDNSNKQKLFYPDYILSYRGSTWIVETKGGFSRGGESSDIDIFSGKKFNVLKDYLDKHNLHGGFVRFDALEDELCICTENYTDDMKTPSWKSIKSVLK